LIEIRNDLISTPSDQEAWADRLAHILTDSLAASGL
jgi:predicted N-formylglutamate amidohydrolase